MLISCPQCSTSFSVPDKALGAGRNLKCAKCGHKWFQTPVVEDSLVLDEEMALPPVPSPRGDSIDNYRPPERDDSDDGADLDFDLDEPPPPDFGQRMASDDVKIDLDIEAPPPMFSADGGASKGTGGLWFLLLLFILGGLGGGIFYYQDLVVRYWPPAAELLTMAGLRAEKPGAGLEFRPAGPPERFVNNDVEVLIMRGVIANVTDRVRPVPAIKLLLLDKDKNVMQEKLTQPPVSQLEPAGTTGFRIILENPDPNAIEVNVVFVDPADQAGK